jgi:shikimate kinase
MPLNKHIVIIGMSGVGKSTLARAVSDKFNLLWYDTDLIIENIYKLTIEEIWESFGEFNFRVMERKVLFDILNMEPGVVSTGGGLTCHFNHMYLLRNYDTIYLEAEEQLILNRIKNLNKPLFKNNLLNSISLKKLLITRKHYYNQANLKVSAEKNIEELVNILGRRIL